MKALRGAFPFFICLPLVVASAGAAQSRGRERQTRFSAMDTDGDGVITRAEWRGSDQSFRRHDMNHDGVLSGSEVRDDAHDTDLTAQFRQADRNGDGVLSRAEWWADTATFRRVDGNADGRLSLEEFLGEDVDGVVPERQTFASLDRNGNGVITATEWPGRRDFDALDADRDGVISRVEYRAEYRADDANQSAAYRAGRGRGLVDGRQAGREDRTINGGKWDLEGQRELETADAGYQPDIGPRNDYQAGYRAGFRAGYRDGFGPR